jgi:hypothetical protein
MVRIDLTQERGRWRVFVNTIMNLLVTYSVNEFLSNCTIGGFSRKSELRKLVSYTSRNWRLGLRDIFKSTWPVKGSLGQWSMNVRP